MKFSEKVIGPKPLNGGSDFAELAKNPSYVDKTGFIEDFLCAGPLLETQDPTEPILSGEKVSLFSRPRRFGKSSILSMLDYFFSVQHQALSPSLFAKLAIAQRKDLCERYQGQFPVIKIDLGDIKESSFSGFLESFTLLIQDVFNRFAQNLANSRHDDGFANREELQRYVSGDVNATELANALNTLSEWMHECYGTKAIVLIDEYDAPMHTAYAAQFDRTKNADEQAEIFSQIKAFLGKFFRSTLKSNKHLERAVVCGVLRVGQMSLFSDMNNVAYYSPLSPDYATYFGFTEAEVEQLVAQRFGPEQLQGRMALLKAWYNGYSFGNSLLYNPWSIISYLIHNRTQPYWVNTGGTQLLEAAILSATPDLKHALYELLQSKTVDCFLDERVTFKHLGGEEAFWGLMLTAGYITVRKIINQDQLAPYCSIATPNKEVRMALQSLISTWFSNTLERSHPLHKFYMALGQGDASSIQSFLEDYLFASASYFNVGRKTQENTYHVLLLGMIVGLKDEYIIESDMESGLGRFDVSLTPKDKTKPGMILEFKQSADADREQLEQLAQTALTQIHDQHYATQQRQHGVAQTMNIGLAFNGKHVAVATDLTGA